MDELFIRVDKGMEIVPWISFEIFVVMLFSLKLLLFFEVFALYIVCIGVSTPSPSPSCQAPL